MIFGYNRRGLISRAERAAEVGDPTKALHILRKLSLQDFGRLLLDVPEDRPALKAFLPRMASEEVQQNWTGASGETLLAQSVAFVASIEKTAPRLLGKPLNECAILDYGCG